MAFVLLFDWRMERSGGADENDGFVKIVLHIRVNFHRLK
jgi:hypothetical protein